MNLSQKKVAAALKNMFVADALAMPVHWFYNPGDIEQAFPGGVTRFEAAPAVHPSSIMSLHSTRAGGREYPENRIWILRLSFATRRMTAGFFHQRASLSSCAQAQDPHYQRVASVPIL